MPAGEHLRWVLADQIEQSQCFGMFAGQTPIELAYGSSLFKGFSQVGIESLNQCSNDFFRF